MVILRVFFITIFHGAKHKQANLGFIQANQSVIQARPHPSLRPVHLLLFHVREFPGYTLNTSEHILPTNKC